MASFGSHLLAAALAGTAASENPLRHVAELPARGSQLRRWPAWVDPDVAQACAERAINAPWSHQLAAAELAHAGRHVVVGTGTASGKSLAYQLPVLHALATDSRARALYLSPTKALGHHQLVTAHALTAAGPLASKLKDVAPTAYDGDSSAEARRFARERSRWLFSNPDMVHLSILRHHPRWAVFLRGLRFIIVDLTDLPYCRSCRSSKCVVGKVPSA
ncbi:MAG: DEAD/DEAH box helicase [Mycobacteriaceae bacterium]|nr:DEAD/DEAH box helicase [Mycobacteriaceae bacterium]